MSDEKGCQSEDCQKVRELLGEYLDAEREAILREVDKHLKDCPDCHLHVDSVKKVIRLYRESSESDVPVDIRIRLQDVIKKARAEGCGD